MNDSVPVALPLDATEETACGRAALTAGNVDVRVVVVTEVDGLRIETTLERLPLALSV